MISKIALTVAAALLATVAHAQTLTLKGPDGRIATVTDAQLRDLHRLTVPAGWGDHHTYAGAPVSDLLALVGGPSDVKLHGPVLDQIVLVTGSDGFIGVMSIAETARSFRDTAVIIADEVDGKPLDAKEGPYRLVIGGELKPARSVRMVTTIELRPVK
ncbi:MAG TPA: molybdopterin-dependent oxidoreductase [Caulobacteraceae bacterium]|jgi:hypothetical protein